MMIDRKRKDVPLIRTHGNACERAKRDATRTVLVLVIVFLALLLLINGASTTVMMQEATVSRQSTPAKAVAVPVSIAPQPVEVVDEAPPQATDEQASNADCFVNREELLAEIQRRVSTLPASQAALQPQHTKSLLDATLELLASDKCLRSHRALLRDTTTDSRFFFDLGSREMDQTMNFWKHYPQASQFHLICYEASGKFTPVYSKFRADHPNARLVFRHAAVGVENTTTVLSDRSVGSSIVRENGFKAQDGDEVVPVVDFASAFVEHLAMESKGGIIGGRFTVMKMDIEKMEYAVLYRMLYTHAILLVDHLLLECHYNTNKPRADRNLSVHIGIDDCNSFVAKLNEVLGSGFEAVMWNSVKTAKPSGYSSRYGGFRPT